jgi:hypothetical protein
MILSRNSLTTSLLLTTLSASSLGACQGGPLSSEHESSSPSAEVAVDKTQQSLTNENGVWSVQAYELQAQEYLKEWATDQTRYYQVLDNCFGLDYYRTAAEAIRGRILRGDFAWLPTVEIVAPEALKGFPAAFAYRENRVFMSSSVPAASRAVLYLEEVGHQFDIGVRRGDSPGDEGELFRRLVLGEVLSAAEVAEIKAQDDMDTITIEGRLVDVEYFFGSGFVKAGLDGVRGGAKWVATSAKSAWETTASAASTASGAIAAAANASWNGATTLSTWIAQGAAASGDYLADVAKRSPLAVAKQLSILKNGLSSMATADLAGLKQFVKATERIAQGDFKGGVADLYASMATMAVAGFDVALVSSLDQVSLAQEFLGFEKPGRSLTVAEISELRPIFENKLNFGKVIVKSGFAGIYSFSDRPFTVRYTIYLKEKAADLALLAHESTHAWQFEQRGDSYVRESIQAQTANKLGVGPGYDWTGASLTRRWSDLNPEQEAGFVGHAYAAGFFATGNGFFRDPKFETVASDHTNFGFDAWNSIACAGGRAYCFRDFSFPMGSAASNEELWPSAGVVDGNTSTAYTSSAFPTVANDRNVWLAAWLSQGLPRPVNELILQARMYAGVANGFPKAYDVYLTSPTNSAWVRLGNFTQQPNASGRVEIPLGVSALTYGVALVPTVLGSDMYGGNYFQLAEVNLGLY